VKQESRPFGPQVKSELGSIDPSAVKRVFSSLGGAFEQCQKAGLSRVEVLAGDVKLAARVGEDGAVKWVYLRDSDLGDRETEKCLLDAVRGARFPKPQGGDAEVQYDIGLAQNASREPNAWHPDRIANVLGKSSAEIDKCKAGASGTFRVTMYVGEAGREGKVLAVGVAPPDQDSESKADCLAKLLKGLKVPTPGTWPAKVTTSL
jgi:hypothetical protein